jgi:hypothetical protein
MRFELSTGIPPFGLWTGERRRQRIGAYLSGFSGDSSDRAGATRDREAEIRRSGALSGSRIRFEVNEPLIAFYPSERQCPELAGSLSCSDRLLPGRVMSREVTLSDAIAKQSPTLRVTEAPLTR